MSTLCCTGSVTTPLKTMFDDLTRLLAIKNCSSEAFFFVWMQPLDLSSVCSGVCHCAFPTVILSSQNSAFSGCGCYGCWLHLPSRRQEAERLGTAATSCSVVPSIKFVKRQARSYKEIPISETLSLSDVSVQLTYEQ